MKTETISKTISIYETIVICNPKNGDKAYEHYKKRMQYKTDLISHKYIHEYYNIITDKLGEKKLAYPIKGNDAGYYFMFTWIGTPKDVTDIEDEFGVDENILKYITVKHECANTEEGVKALFTDFSEREEEVSEREEEVEVNTNTWDALDLFFPDTHLTNDEKYDILKARKEEIL